MTEPSNFPSHSAHSSSRHGTGNVSGYLSGHLLLATPQVASPGFSHSVILLCSHDKGGAMGLVVNHLIENLSYRDLFEQLSIQHTQTDRSPQVHYGGPVEVHRGFVIYRVEKKIYPDTLFAFNDTAVSTSLSLLREIAVGDGPRETILTLGYAGWGEGQLEAEMEQNSWISVPATPELIFATGNQDKWKRAALSSGIDISKLSTSAGHA
jgi:putative transcriptional regulator